MAWDLEGGEALSYVAGLIMAALAILLLRANRQRAQNRWLVGLLAVELVLAVASPSFSVTTDHDVAYTAATVFMTALSFLVPVYLGFLSTLGTSTILVGRAGGSGGRGSSMAGAGGPIAAC